MAVVAPFAAPRLTVHKDEALAIHVALPHPPAVAVPDHIGAVLLSGSERFFVRQAEPVQHVGNRRERLHPDITGRQRRLDLLQRDPGLAGHDGPQLVLVRLQQRASVAADPGRLCAAGLAHSLHQLDGC